MMNVDNHNSFQTTNGSLMKSADSISLTSCLSHPNSTHSHMSLPVAITAQVGNGTSDESSNSLGYVAETSCLQQQSIDESPVKNIHTNQATPLTPTTNLKMLVAAASSALDRERQESEQSRKASVVFEVNVDDPSSSRKMKSLSLLCKKFLQVADEEIGPGKEFSLEMMANSLKINRRRIYDIINVLESLEMISKQSKNWYLWHGRGNLLQTLAKLKAMIPEDPDIQPYLNSNQYDVNVLSNSNEVVIKTEKIITDEHAKFINEPILCSTEVDEDEEQQYFDPTEYPFGPRSVRFDKSLGVLCQKFVMLFLVSQNNEVTLEEAGRILVPDYNDDTIYMALNPPVNPKTKVRRLYDIANILSSLNLIRKKVFIGPMHVKKPGYSWCGPSSEEIENAWSAGKQESKSTLKKMKKFMPGRAPTCIISEPQTDSSLYPSPIKPMPRVLKFKRSLSFDDSPNTTNSWPSKIYSTPQLGRQPTVLARPLCSKQVDYLKEMREFENEMNKHAHRYPHVASVFHEFIQKYQSTLEQTAAANGRFILPKAVSATPPSLVCLSNQQESNNKLADSTNNLPCNCGQWDSLLTDGNVNLSSVSQSSIQPQGILPNPVNTTQVTNDKASTSLQCSMPSNNYVTNLANTILVSILGTIQNSATVEQASHSTTPVSTNCLHKQTAAPLTEIRNLQDKTMPVNKKEGFFHVDELLIKSDTSTTPCSDQKALSVATTTSNNAATVNPNAFLTINNDQHEGNKENQPLQYDVIDGEKAIKRQRMD